MPLVPTVARIPTDDIHAMNAYYSTSVDNELWCVTALVTGRLVRMRVTTRYLSQDKAHALTD